MAKIVPYLVGGLAAFVVADLVPLPSPSEQFGALRASFAAPAPLLGTPDSSVNRGAKGDRVVAARAAPAVTVVTNGILPEVTVRQYGDGVVKPVPMDAVNEPTPATKPRKGPKVPLGCESAFSSVAAPSLAHHIGRCMARLDTRVMTAKLDG